MFDTLANVEPNAPKIVVLFSDGMYDLVEAASVNDQVSQLVASSVHIFSVGTSNQNNFANLKFIASNSGTINLIDLDDLSSIFLKINEITKKYCGANVFRFIENYVED